MNLPNIGESRTRSYSRMTNKALNSERLSNRNDIQYRQLRTRLIKSALEQTPIKLDDLNVQVPEV